MSDSALLSIIIVNWNTRDLLCACLDSIRRWPPACEYDVWVVDNASTDGSADMLRQSHPEARVIENARNEGFGAANNRAIAASASQYILFLNSDAQLTEGACDGLLDMLRQTPAAGACGPKLVNPDGTFQASFARFPNLLAELLLVTGLARFTTGPYAPSPKPFSGEAARPVDWVAGAALCARREAITQIGGFDSRFFLYSEETFLCWQLRQRGWQTWYAPQIQVVHIGGASSKLRSVESYNALYASKLRFFQLAYGEGAARRLKHALRLVAQARSLLWRVLNFMAGSDKSRQRLERERILIKHLGSIT